MRNAEIVIGANFGDEGKGLMTDYFATKSTNGIVVRFNGGAQAGHTVVTPEGLRHIFAHFGSGSLVGVPTYLSKYFIANPICFNNELDVLIYNSFFPNVYIDEGCLVTTPYDMMINQLVESSRGDKRHGSCGVGVNETIKRSENEEVKISVKDLYDEGKIRNILDIVRKTYVYARLKELQIEMPKELSESFKNDNIIDNFIDDIDNMVKYSTMTNARVLKLFNDLIFEGAQGLLLDQNHRYFPNVTPSNTGVKNVVEILREINYHGDININYVTRCYMTRHGNGEFPTETPDKPFPKIEDMTNVKNEYQGSLRFGTLDIDGLKSEIQNDLKHAKDFKYKLNLAITCLDQLPCEKLDIINKIFKATEINEGYISFGETRDKIKKIQRRIPDE